MTLNERNWTQVAILAMGAALLVTMLSLMFVVVMSEDTVVVVPQVPTTNYFDSLDEYWDEYREWQECNMENAALICGRAPIKPTTINMP